MAAPKRNRSKPSDAAYEKTRQSIQATQLVKRLQCYALNEKDPQGNIVELETNRVRAIEVLLRKVLPDMTHNENDNKLSMDDDLTRLMADIAEKKRRVDDNND